MICLKICSSISRLKIFWLSKFYKIFWPCWLQRPFLRCSKFSFWNFLAIRILFTEVTIIQEFLTAFFRSGIDIYWEFFSVSSAPKLILGLLLNLETDDFCLKFHWRQIHKTHQPIRLIQWFSFALELVYEWKVNFYLLKQNVTRIIHPFHVVILIKMFGHMNNFQVGFVGCPQSFG